MNSTLMRRRLTALRERRGMTQEELAKALGLKDRQSVSSIELGDRRIAADELVRLAQIFDVNLEFFTDPFQLAGEAAFSWRRNDAADSEIRSFERKAEGWLGLYRHLSRLAEEPVNSRVPRLDLNDRSSYEEAAAEGEAVAKMLNLGAVPAEKLAQSLDRELDVLVLHVDAPHAISGAACRIGALDAILINRHEPAHRRAFNIAHELFHLATWHEMPPKHVENASSTHGRYKRVEQLANNFAAGLLMPRHALQQILSSSQRPETDELPEWITALARKLGVSGQAMMWRLKEIGVIRKADALRIDPEKLRIDEAAGGPKPAPFSRRFVERLRWVIDEGHLSVRRAASVMSHTVDELKALFDAHQIAAPFDL